MYVTRKCPYCKYNFETLSADWIAFGDPRIKCPKCGKYVLFKNIKEWRLRSSIDRIWIITRHYIFHNLAYSFGIVLIIFLLMAIIPAIWGSSFNETFKNLEDSTIFIVGLSIVFPIILIKRHRKFKLEVDKSNKRMDDPNYASEMEKIRY